MISSIGYNLGIGSGLDTKSLIENLAAAEKAPKEAMIKAREEANSAKVSALADASGAIDGFASALATLIGGGTLFSQPSVSDPSMLGAVALPGARLANLSSELEVLQLAKSQTLVSAPIADPAAPIGQGDLTITVGGVATVITIGAGNDSLTGLAAAINAKNSGVTASIVTDQGTSRLVLKGGTGEAKAFTIGASAAGLDRFAYDGVSTTGMTRAQTAQDAVVKLDGVEVRRGSNSFSDLVPGVQFDLKKAVPGTTVSLGVTRPTAAIDQAMGDFVTAYNELANLLAAAGAAGTAGAQAGPLRGDVAIRDMRRLLAELPTKVLASQGSFKTLAEIGVATNRDGTLSLNRARLQDALQKDPTGVEALFNPVQYSSDPLVRISSGIGRTKPGTYALSDLVPGTAGGNASGKIDGLIAGATGNFLIAPATSKAVGLVFEVLGPVSSATITVDAGLGGALQAIRDEVRARSGPIAKSQARLSEEAKDIAEDRAKLELRSQAYYDRLVKNFTAMERSVSAARATQSYLEQQIKAWNGNDD